MTDDELLATVLRRFIRSDVEFVLSLGNPRTLRLDGIVELTVDEQAALYRECRAWVKVLANGNGHGPSMSTSHVYPGCATMGER